MLKNSQLSKFGVLPLKENFKGHESNGSLFKRDYLM